MKAKKRILSIFISICASAGVTSFLLSDLARGYKIYGLPMRIDNTPSAVSAFVTGAIVIYFLISSKMKSKANDEYKIDDKF